MKKKFILLLLTACLGLGTAGVHAAEAADPVRNGSQSLEEAFSELAIIPLIIKEKRSFKAARRMLVGITKSFNETDVSSCPFV